MLQKGDGSLQFGGLKNVDVTNYPMDLSVLVEDTLQVEYTIAEPFHGRAGRADQGAVRASARRADAGRIGVAWQHRSGHGGRRRPCRQLQSSRDISGGLPLVHEAISVHAKYHPERTALTIGGTALSFGDLDVKANRLAHHLIARGLKPEQRVGVVVERTEATMVALLAVLKAGGAYVPLDPELPPERRKFVMRDAGVSFLLTGQLEEGLDRVERISLPTFDFDAGPDHTPQPDLHADNLAYLIYTSGSTGTPKGVAVAHGPLAMHCHVTGSLYEIDEGLVRIAFPVAGFRRRARTLVDGAVARRAAADA